MLFHVHIEPTFFTVGPMVLMGVLFEIWHWFYVGMRFSRSMVLALATMAGTMVWMFTAGSAVVEGSPLNLQNNGDGALVLSEWMFVAMGAQFAVGIGVKFYRALVLNQLTEEERKASWAGIRAWMRPMGLGSAAGIAAGAYFGMGWSAWGTGAGAVAVLLAYPVGNFILHGEGAADMEEAQDISEERRRVLSLVEAGKISAEDGAELLAALGQSRAPARDEARGMRVSGNVRMMIVGAVLVVVGFCLPWFEIDLGKELGGLMDRLGSVTPTGQMNVNVAGVKMNVPADWSGSVSVPVEVNHMLILRGGDIRYGLGWIILAMGLGAAVLPLG